MATSKQHTKNTAPAQKQIGVNGPVQTTTVNDDGTVEITNTTTTIISVDIYKKQLDNQITALQNRLEQLQAERAELD